MIECPKCNSENSDSSKFCVKCGESLESAGDNFEIVEKEIVKYCEKCGHGLTAENKEYCPKCGAELKSKQRAYCSNCGKSIDENALICPNCGAGTGKIPTNDKSPALALVLSFLIPGVGQIYAGLTKRGLIFLAAIIVCYMLFILVIPPIIGFVLWIYNMYDAYESAKKVNMGIAV